jgi:hypothetical protein
MMNWKEFGRKLRSKVKRTTKTLSGMRLSELVPPAYEGGFITCVSEVTSYLGYVALGKKSPVCSTISPVW